MQLPVLFLKSGFFFTFCLGAGTWAVGETKFSLGDFVQISPDEDLVTELHSHGIGFNEAMKPTLGKIGKVKYINTYGDPNVVICNTTTWVYSAKAVTKLAPAGVSGPEVSWDCERSNTTVKIQQERLENDVILKCIVDDISPSSSVHWIKDHHPILSDSYIKGVSPRRAVSYDESGHYKLQIEHIKPEDAGWYTCEVTNRGHLQATGAVEVTFDHKAEDGKFKKGDLVQITSDERLIKELNINGIGYVDGMQKTLGKIGQVKSVEDDGNLNVAICNTTWYYNPNAVIKIASAGTTTPLVSLDCIRSETSVKISHVKVEKIEKLICIVNNKPKNSYVRWVRGTEQITRNADLLVPNPRITASSNITSHTIELQIDEMTSEDAGLYTCEVRANRGLFAAGAVELKVKKEPFKKHEAEGTSSPHPEAETTPAAEEELQNGDVVQVLSDEDTVREKHRGRLASAFSAMKQTLGKIGIVISQDVNNDLYVNICGHYFYYHPKAIVKLASAGSGAPKRSSKCVHSNATIIFKQSIIGNAVNLTCTVPEKDSNLIVRWVKEEKVIYQENSLGRPDIKESFEGASQIFTLQINDVQPEDKGWYGCELVDRDANEVAISVVNVGARRSSPHPETEMTTETATTTETETAMEIEITTETDTRKEIQATTETETAMEIEITTETDTTKEIQATTETGTTTAAPEVEFAVGDMVQVLSNEDTVKERFGGRIEFIAAMRKTLGKIGRVKLVNDTKHLLVELCGGSWLYSRNSVRKLALAGKSTLEKSSDCAESAAIALIYQAVMTWPRSNHAEELRFSCKLVNATDVTHVLWRKDGQLITRDLVKYIADPRITVHTGLYTNESILLIVDVKPEDAGWYTCELRSDDQLLAVAASKSSARRPLTWPTETTFQPTEMPDTPVEEFKHGDIVQVSSDEATVKRHFGILDFNDEMPQTLGKIGRVILQDSDNDVLVKICDNEWWYRPSTISKLAAAGSSAPEISSDCVRSYTTPVIKTERVGAVEKLMCTVFNKSSADSFVSWTWEGVRVTRNVDLYGSDPRITIHHRYPSSTYTLEIDSMERVDAGWYTCEVRTVEDKLEAIRAVQLNYHQPEERTSPTSCVDCAASSEEFQDILIMNPAARVRSQQGDAARN